jgi:hypothetical protein
MLGVDGDDYSDQFFNPQNLVSQDLPSLYAVFGAKGCPAEILCQGDLFSGNFDVPSTAIFLTSIAYFALKYLIRSFDRVLLNGLESSLCSYQLSSSISLRSRASQR